MLWSVDANGVAWKSRVRVPAGSPFTKYLPMRGGTIERAWAAWYQCCLIHRCNLRVMTKKSLKMPRVHGPCPRENLNILLAEFRCATWLGAARSPVLSM